MTITIKKNEDRNIYLFYYLFTRVLFLLIMFIFSDKVVPYYTYDDYKLYSVVRLNTIDIPFCIYQREIWTIVCATLNSISPYIELPRLLNVIFGWQSICELNRTLKIMGCSSKVVDRATKFMIFIPQYIIFTCSEVKDVLFLLCVWVIINEMLILIQGEHCNVVKIITFSFLGIFLRFGVIESLLIALLCYFIIRNNSHNKWLVMAIGVIAIIVGYRIYGAVNATNIFEQKTRYLTEANLDFSFNSVITTLITIPREMIGAGPRLHPQEGEILWISFLGYISFANIYMLIFFGAWLFDKNKEWMERIIFYFFVIWMLFLVYTDHVIYRQILFLQPVMWILSCKKMYSSESDVYRMGSIFVTAIVYLVMFITVRM